MKSDELDQRPESPGNASGGDAAMPAAVKKRRIRRAVILCSVGIPLVILIVGILKQGRPFDAKRPPADAEPGRWVWIEGAQNTRDIGGYKTRDGRTVRRGRLYRSGTLSRVTHAGCEAFRDLGIVTVIDFRNRLKPWPIYNGDVLGIHRAASVYGFPISFAHQENFKDFYLVGFRENTGAFRRAFEMLAESDRLPLLFHCQAGLDRTGVMAALILTLLGVDRETVMADFKLAESLELFGNVVAMERLLDEVEATGGIETFLAGIGVTPDLQAKIRAQLLE